MNNNNKCICLAIHSLQAGGMERVIAELAGFFFKKENVTVHIILYGIKRDIFYPLPAGIFIHKPSFAFNDNKRLLSTIRTILFLRKKIRAINPETVLSFGECWNSMVLLSTLGMSYPVFVSDRSQPNKSLGKVQDLLRKYLYPFANGVIAQTEKAKEIYQSIYKHRNITVIGNPIREIITAGNSVEKENIVLMVGRLIKTKHQDKLIELFVAINLPGWRLVIVGYDHMKQKNMEKLQVLISELDATDKVILAGKQYDVESFYLKSKIFAFTSSSEGFPNVIGEAMSAGLPVVAFDCVAGPAEMIQDNKNGFLIPLFHYDVFQQKLTLLMKQDLLREKMGQSAKQSIRQFEVESIGNQFYNFILAG